MKNYTEIRRIYVKRYAHLDTLKDSKEFAKQALRLAAPMGITPMDTWTLAKIATN